MCVHVCVRVCVCVCVCFTSQAQQLMIQGDMVRLTDHLFSWLDSPFRSTDPLAAADTDIYGMDTDIGAWSLTHYKCTEQHLRHRCKYRYVPSSLCRLQIMCCTCWCLRRCFVMLSHDLNTHNHENFWMAAFRCVKCAPVSRTGVGEGSVALGLPPARTRQLAFGCHLLIALEALGVLRLGTDRLARQQ